MTLSFACGTLRLERVERVLEGHFGAVYAIALDDTCVSYEEEDTCVLSRVEHRLRRRIHVFHMRRRIHVC
jgi:hypothetical protein